MFGEKSYKITRVYLLNDKPYILFNHYLPYPLSSLDEYGELKHNNDLSIYKILEDEQIEIKDIEDNFSVGLNEQATAYLNLQTSDPLLVRERISYSVNNQIVEYSIGYYNSKLKKYSINLKG